MSERQMFFLLLMFLGFITLLILAVGLSAADPLGEEDHDD